MFWKPNKRSITIPAELHDQLRQSCTPCPPEEGEVLAVRSVDVVSSSSEDVVQTGDPFTCRREETAEQPGTVCFAASC